jgi:prepilin-type N-terminal cleavage/methylation domain-containing protein
MRSFANNPPLCNLPPDRPDKRPAILWQRRGYTIIELMLVMALMGILAAILLPQFEPSIHEQLQGAAQIVSADIAYARNLAVAHGTQYQLSFNTATNSYTLRHSGTNNLFDVLPVTPYRSSADSPDVQVTHLDDLPRIGAAVEIAGVQIGGNATAASGSLEFTALGGLVDSEPMTIWLACGADGARRYLPVTVMPVTGLCETGDFVATPP